MDGRTFAVDRRVVVDAGHRGELVLRVAGVEHALVDERVEVH